MNRWWVGLSALAVACATASVDDGRDATGGAGGKAGAGGAAGSAGDAAGSGGSAGEAGAPSGGGGQAGSDGGAAGSVGGGGTGGTGGTSGSGGSGGTPDPPVDCAVCTASLAPACGSTAVVVGHYTGGARTVCIQAGAESFELALMSYETTQWTLAGDISRVTQLQIYSYDAFGSISGNGAIPTSVQVGGDIPADPYDYAMSMGDCPAHTGYAGAVFGEAQANVCHMETGLSSACSSPLYSCLLIDP